MANSRANGIAIALAEMEKCQDPIETFRYYFLADPFRPFPTLAATVFDEHGNFDLLKLRELENKEFERASESERCNWHTDYGTFGLGRGMEYDYFASIGNSLPRRRELLKGHDLNIIALATALVERSSMGRSPTTK